MDYLVVDLLDVLDFVVFVDLDLFDVADFFFFFSAYRLLS